MYTTFTSATAFDGEPTCGHGEAGGSNETCWDTYSKEIITYAKRGNFNGRLILQIFLWNKCVYIAKQRLDRITLKRLCLGIQKQPHQPHTTLIPTLTKTNYTIPWWKYKKAKQTSWYNDTKQKQHLSRSCFLLKIIFLHLSICKGTKTILWFWISILSTIGWLLRTPSPTLGDVVSQSHPFRSATFLITCTIARRSTESSRSGLTTPGLIALPCVANDRSQRLHWDGAKTITH